MKVLKKCCEYNIFIFILVYVSQFSTTICQQIVLITYFFFFTSTHSLLLLQLIFLYFYLDFISSTCLPPCSLVSFQIPKSKSYLLTFGQSSCGHPQNLWEMVKTLKKIKKIKKWKRRKLEEHRRCRDHEEKWKVKQKRDQDTREMLRIVKFVEKLF